MKKDYGNEDPNSLDYWEKLGSFLVKGSVVFMAAILIILIILDWLGFIEM